MKGSFIINIKKATIKTIAAALALINLASTFPTHAADNPVLDPLLTVFSAESGSGERIITNVLRNMEEITSARDRQIREFLELGEEHFKILDDVVSNVHPLVLYSYIKVINDFFKKYPHIKAKFIQLNGHNFHIQCADAAELGITAPDVNLNFSPRFTCSFLTIINRAQQKDVMHVYQTALQGIQAEFFSPVTLNLYSILARSVAHELGHLFESLVFADDFIKNNRRDLEEIAFLDDSVIQSLTEKIRDEPDVYVNLQPSITLSKYYEKARRARSLFSRQMTPEFDRIKARLCRRARETFISGYGKSDSKEWFAEGFANAILSRKPTKIGQAILEYLDKKEREFAAETDKEKSGNALCCLVAPKISVFFDDDF